MTTNTDGHVRPTTVFRTAAVVGAVAAVLVAQTSMITGPRTRRSLRHLGTGWEDQARARPALVVGGRSRPVRGTTRRGAIFRWRDGCATRSRREKHVQTTVGARWTVPEVGGVRQGRPVREATRRCTEAVALRRGVYGVTTAVEARTRALTRALRPEGELRFLAPAHL